jgi:UDP-N-acetylglucosamine--N-acetylmuramyl-(pentapeptide) pyrophosphoryl-undecaprenol N-acetylglucosamine transferase
MSAPVLVMAGGTGGHVFPGLAVAAALKQLNVPVVWLGAEGGMEQSLVPKHDIPFVGIRVQGIRGKGWRRQLQVPLELGRAFLQARRALKRIAPRSVLSMGGYAAGPGGLAAFWLRRPLLVHEQNRIPGLTNRVLAQLARRILTGFPGAFEGRGEWVGNPVREEIAQVASPAARLAGRSGPLRLLVIGGSQGARALNQVLPETLALLPESERPQVWHQCGARMIDDTLLHYRQAGVSARAVAFIDDMAAAYEWADLVLCRSGALTLAELAAAGVASLLVPYPHAVDDHQTANARWLADAGAAELLPEAQLNAAVLKDRLHAFATDRRVLLQMAERARSLARTDAAQVVAQACLECAR